MFQQIELSHKRSFESCLCYFLNVFLRHFVKTKKQNFIESKRFSFASDRWWDFVFCISFVERIIFPCLLWETLSCPQSIWSGRHIADYHFIPRDLCSSANRSIIISAQCNDQKENEDLFLLEKYFNYVLLGTHENIQKPAREVYLIFIPILLRYK